MEYEAIIAFSSESVAFFKTKPSPKSNFDLICCILRTELLVFIMQCRFETRWFTVYIPSFIQFRFKKIANVTSLNLTIWLKMHFLKLCLLMFGWRDFKEYCLASMKNYLSTPDAKHRKKSQCKKQINVRA